MLTLKLICGLRIKTCLLCILSAAFARSPQDTQQATPLPLSLVGVREDSRSEISGVGQRKCNSLHSLNSLASKVCHLAGFNLALEPSGSTWRGRHDCNSGREPATHKQWRKKNKKTQSFKAREPSTLKVQYVRLLCWRYLQDMKKHKEILVLCQTSMYCVAKRVFQS